MTNENNIHVLVFFFNYVKSEAILIKDKKKKEYTQTCIILKLQYTLTSSKYVDPPYPFNPDNWR